MERGTGNGSPKGTDKDTGLRKVTHGLCTPWTNGTSQNGCYKACREAQEFLHRDGLRWMRAKGPIVGIQTLDVSAGCRNITDNV